MSKVKQTHTHTHTHKYTCTYIHKHIKKNQYEKKNLVATYGKFKLIFNYYLKMYITYIHNW